MKILLRKRISDITCIFDESLHLTVLTDYLNAIRQDQPERLTSTLKEITERKGEAFVHELLADQPLLNILFSKPNNPAEWALLSQEDYALFEQTATDTIENGTAAQFDVLLSSPDFNPLLYRRGVTTLFDAIDESVTLDAEEKDRRKALLKDCQTEYAKTHQERTLSIDLSKGDFSLPNLATFETDELNSRPAAGTRFLTLVTWLENKGFNKFATILRNNTGLQTSSSFSQVVFQLNVLCARISEALQSDELSEIITEDGIEKRVLKSRSEFDKDAIIDQARACPEGVMEAFTKLSTFLGLRFEQQLLEGALKETIVPFMLQYKVRLGMQVHLDQASLLANMGIALTEAEYRNDPYRLSVPQTHLKALSRKALSTFHEGLMRHQQTLLNCLDALSAQKTITPTTDGLRVLKRLCDASEEIGKQQPWILVLTHITDYSEPEAIAWVRSLILMDPVPVALKINQEKLRQFKKEVETSWFPLLKREHKHADLLKDFLSNETLDAEAYQTCLDDVFTAPDGLYIAKSMIEELLCDSETPWHVERLLMPNHSGQSLFSAFATDPLLSEWLVDRKIQFVDGLTTLAPLGLRHPSLYDLAATASRTSTAGTAAGAGGPVVPRTNSMLDSQIDKLLHARGATNFCLGFLGRDDRFAGTIDKVLSFLSSQKAYTFDSFADLLKTFAKQNPYHKTLVTSFWEARLATQREDRDWEAYLLTANALQQPLSTDIIEEISASGVLEDPNCALNVKVMFYSQSLQQPASKEQSIKGLASLGFPASYDKAERYTAEYFEAIIRFINKELDPLAKKSLSDGAHHFFSAIPFQERKEIVKRIVESDEFLYLTKLNAHYLLAIAEGRHKHIEAFLTKQKPNFGNALINTIEMLGGCNINTSLLSELLNNEMFKGKISQKEFLDVIQALGGKDIKPEVFTILISNKAFFRITKASDLRSTIFKLGGQTIHDDILSQLFSAEVQNQIREKINPAEIIMLLGWEKIKHTSLSMVLSNPKSKISNIDDLFGVSAALGYKKMKPEVLELVLTPKTLSYINTGNYLAHFIDKLGGMDIQQSARAKLLSGDMLSKLKTIKELKSVIESLGGKNIKLSVLQMLLPGHFFLHDRSVATFIEILASLGGKEVKQDVITLLLSVGLRPKVNNLLELISLINALGGRDIMPGAFQLLLSTNTHLISDNAYQLASILDTLGGKETQEALQTQLVSAGLLSRIVDESDLLNILQKLDVTSIQDQVLTLLSSTKILSTIVEIDKLAAIIEALGGKNSKHENLQLLLSRVMPSNVRDGYDLLKLVKALGGKEANDDLLKQLFSRSVCSKINNTSQLAEIIHELGAEAMSDDILTLLKSYDLFSKIEDLSDLARMITALGAKNILEDKLEMLMSEDMLRNIDLGKGLGNLIEALGGKNISEDKLEKLSSLGLFSAIESLYELAWTVRSLGGKDIGEDRLRMLLSDDILQHVDLGKGLGALIKQLGGKAISADRLEQLISKGMLSQLQDGDELALVMKATGGKAILLAGNGLIYYLLNSNLLSKIQNKNQLVAVINALGGEEIPTRDLNRLLSDNLPFEINDFTGLLDIIKSLGGRNIKLVHLEKLITNRRLPKIDSIYKLQMLIKTLGGKDIEQIVLYKILSPEVLSLVNSGEKVGMLINSLGSHKIESGVLRTLLSDQLLSNVLNKQAGFTDTANETQIQAIISAFGPTLGRLQARPIDIFLTSPTIKSNLGLMCLALKVVLSPNVYRLRVSQRREDRMNHVVQLLSEQIKEKIYNKESWFTREKTLIQVFNSGAPFTELYRRACDHDGASRKTLQMFGFSGF